MTPLGTGRRRARRLAYLSEHKGPRGGDHFIAPNGRRYVVTCGWLDGRIEVTPEDGAGEKLVLTAKERRGAGWKKVRMTPMLRLQDRVRDLEERERLHLRERWAFQQAVGELTAGLAKAREQVESAEQEAREMRALHDEVSRRLKAERDTKKALGRGAIS